jgi:hypothetical protein
MKEIRPPKTYFIIPLNGLDALKILPDGVGDGTETMMMMMIWGPTIAVYLHYLKNKYLSNK